MFRKTLVTADSEAVSLGEGGRYCEVILGKGVIVGKQRGFSKNYEICRLKERSDSFVCMHVLNYGQANRIVGGIRVRRRGCNFVFSSFILAKNQEKGDGSKVRLRSESEPFVVSQVIK